MKRRASLSTHAEAQAAAEECLIDGGSALHAVVSGFFMAAGLSRGALLGPLGLLTGGVGHGAKAFDGRAREPGLDARRPRGFTTDEPPRAAFAAAPGSLSALVVALGYHGGRSLLSCARPGIAAARRIGAPKRAGFIETVVGAGGNGLRQPAIQRALLAVAGPTAGGTLSTADLEMRFSPENPAFIGPSGEARLSWAEADPLTSDPVSDLRRHVVIAVDAAGLCAALCFFDGEGVPVNEFEIDLPALARPVLRGVRRAKPGAAIATPMDLTLEGGEGSWERVSARGAPSDAPLVITQDRRTRTVSVSRA